MGFVGNFKPYNYSLVNVVNFSLFLEENSDRIDKAHINNMTSGQVTVFPHGYIHYEQNLACTPANFISALNSEDPG